MIGWIVIHRDRVSYTENKNNQNIFYIAKSYNYKTLLFTNGIPRDVERKIHKDFLTKKTYSLKKEMASDVEPIKAVLPSDIKSNLKLK